MRGEIENNGHSQHVHFTNGAEIIIPRRVVQIFYTTNALATFDFTFSH
jgi:hypothetical protein